MQSLYNAAFPTEQNRFKSSMQEQNENMQSYPLNSGSPKMMMR